MAHELVTFANTIDDRKESAGATFESFDQFTGQPWAALPRCGATDVDRAVKAARKAFRSGEWGGLPASARGRLLVVLADLIARDVVKLAAIEIRDNGKFITETTAQLRHVPELFRHFGGLADKTGGAVLPIGKAVVFHFTRREPLEVIAAIAPWNLPPMFLALKLAPLLAAGNKVVITPSAHTSALTLAFVELFTEARFPAGVVNIVTGMSLEVGLPLVNHLHIAKIAFTGGEAGGLFVCGAAATRLKPVTLKLGRKSANIVFADTDLGNAVNGAMAGIFTAAGQTCMTGSRLLVQRSVHDRVVKGVTALTRTARIGNPSSSDTRVGPITTLSRFRKAVPRPFARTLRQNKKLSRRSVGLATQVCLAPFGGYKRSGLGRENGQEAIEVYLQTKTVWIDTVGTTANPFAIR